MNSSAPALTDSLSTPVQFLKGVGPTRSTVLEKHGVLSIGDLFMYIPRRYLDKTAIVTIAEVRQMYTHQIVNSDKVQHASGATDVSRHCTVVGEVRSFSVVGYRSKARFVLVLADQTGSMQCVWFGGVQYWKKAFHVGELLAVSGQPSFYGRVLQFVHPDLDRIASANQDDDNSADSSRIDWSKTLNTGGLVPLYPSGRDLERVGLDSAGFRRVINLAIRSYLDSISETLPDSIIRAYNFVALRAAIHTVHFPKAQSELERSLYRLKYDEFFYFQLKLALRRRWVKESTQGISFSVKSKMARQLVDSLPFRLTKAQIRVINEIASDMEVPKPLNRLLQGDVGSGKTIVALISMLIAVESGYQAAFLAPTEILAEQHYRTLSALLKSVPVSIRLLIGGQRSRLRRDVLDDLQRGSAQIVVGTHALFEKDVEFAKLGFVVIDEQHRFGVMQRASIRKKGSSPDVLVMTATPIPRTLSLTLYGELDVSVIDELPGNRKPIKTILRYDDEKASVFHFVRDQVRQGRQAYFVYPLVEESEKVDLKAATVHFEYLQRKAFPDLRLGLIHGRLPSDEKDSIMENFARREIDVLVATTVIEVGIDVPNASLMVIENAERFGLSQLHQLRGRVGRGSEQSYCVLLTKRWIAKHAEHIMRGAEKAREALEQQRQAERRLATMVETNDGFKIAEVDLQLRGPGDFFGTRQSGVPEFKVANIVSDTTILDEARADAFDVVARDPYLRRPEHQMIANHLRSHFHEALMLLQTA
jgi:ATP-dependent DNA helicase RecG